MDERDPLLQMKTAETAHIEILQVWPGAFSNFWAGAGDKATAEKSPLKTSSSQSALIVRRN